jgi:hypothetical protein
MTRRKRAALDRKAVIEIVREYAPPPPDLVIRRDDAPPVKIEGAHYLVPRIVKLMSARIPVLVWGEAGTGKTTLAAQVADALGLEFHFDTLTRDSSRVQIYGYRAPDGTPVETPTTRAYAAGDRAMLAHDEVGYSPPSVQGMLNSALANGILPAAWGDLRGAPAYLATDNTPLGPTEDHPDREEGSPAYKDRLYFIRLDLDENIIRRACGLSPVRRAARPEATCTAADWGTWVLSARAWCKRNAPNLHVGQRAALVGLRALAAGETPEEVAEGLVFKGCDPSLRSKVLDANPLPGAR